MVSMTTMPEYEHIKHNRIVKLYYNAIVKLLSKMPAEKISVQMILDETETSRCTFYKYFPDKFALMNYVYYYDNWQLEELKKQPAHVWKDYTVYDSKIEYYQHLFQYEGQNSFREFYRRLWLKRYTEEFIRINGEDKMNLKVRICFLFFIDGLYNTKRDYIMETHKHLPITEIHKICLMFQPAIIKDIEANRKSDLTGFD